VKIIIIIIIIIIITGTKNGPIVMLKYLYSRYNEKMIYTYITCIWRFRCEWPRLFCRDVRHQKTRGYRVALFTWSHVSRFSRTPTCDRQTHTTTAHTALARRRAVKMNNSTRLATSRVVHQQINCRHAAVPWPLENDTVGPRWRVACKVLHLTPTRQRHLPRSLSYL